MLPALLAAALVAGGHGAVPPASAGTGAVDAKARAGALTHLLTADSLPGVGDDAWVEHSTGAEGSRPVGVCQQATLVDIGALDVVVRAFRGPDGPDGSDLRVRQAIARYADAKSAWRAHEVLRAWRADCAHHLDHATGEVGPMVEVDLETGTGGRYLVTYGPENGAHSALGLVRHGRWLAVIEIRATGGTLPAAWPLRAVRRIAATF